MTQALRESRCFSCKLFRKNLSRHFVSLFERAYKIFIKKKCFQRNYRSGFGLPESVIAISKEGIDRCSPRFDRCDLSEWSYASERKQKTKIR